MDKYNSSLVQVLVLQGTSLRRKVIDSSLIVSATIATLLLSIPTTNLPSLSMLILDTTLYSYVLLFLNQLNINAYYKVYYNNLYSLVKLTKDTIMDTKSKCSV